MATTIVTKSGSGAPTASDLVAGELAVDLTNGRLYTEDSGGTVLELGLNPSGNVDVTGSVTATGTSVFASLDISGDIDVAGTTNLDVVDIDGAVDMASTLGVTGVATLASLVATTADINGGTIDGTVIGGTTAAAGSFTTGSFSSTLGVTGVSTLAAMTATTGTFSGAFTSLGIDDNADAVALTIDSAERALFGHSAAIQGTKVEISAVGDGGALGLFGRASDDAAYIGFFENGVATRTATIQATPAAGLQFISGSGSTAQMTLDASGNFLVGTTLTLNGGHVLKIASGTVSTVETNATTNTNMIVFRNGNGNVGSIHTDGSATSFNTSSDERLKENIADADDAGAKIDAIQVRKFDWKADGSHQDYGMVAQELQVVAPEAVSAPEDSDEMMGVDYSKLVPMMLKEIQSLRARIAALES